MHLCRACGVYTSTRSGKFVRHGPRRAPCLGSHRTPSEAVEAKRKQLIREYNAALTLRNESVRTKFMHALRSTADKLGIDVIWPE